MKSNDNNKSIRSLTRRDFTKKSIFAIVAVGRAGLIGYSAFNTEKLRAICNVRRMGHCAPSIMQTLLDINNIKNTNLVLYAGAMAGGIAGPDMECGSLTAGVLVLSSNRKNRE